MKTILIAGGNSGIGLQAAREFLQRGHKVVLLGRSKHKGKEALASFGKAAERASFFSVDLSTHAGVRDAAKRILAENDHFDVILHSTGVFMPNKDIRTSNNLNMIFAVNYLSRYHLTQLLLPALLKSKQGHVVMMIPKISPTTKIEVESFPELLPFSDKRFGDQISACNHHYAVHLAKKYPGLIAGVVNAGWVKTDILRETPRFMRVMAKIMTPLFFDSIEEAAHNPVEACLRDDLPAATYWEKPGKFDSQTPIVVDNPTTHGIITFSQKITGV